MLAATFTRVQEHTAAEVNEQIRLQTERNIVYYAYHPEQIDGRLQELDREWEIDRLLQTQAASLMLLGTALGVTLNRKWLILPMVVGGFLLQHALQGWCPPVPVWRRLGVRTSREIDTERQALKAIRGDYRQVPAAESIDRAGIERVLEAARAQ